MVAVTDFRPFAFSGLEPSLFVLTIGGWFEQETQWWNHLHTNASPRY
jgi:hypothetical protein